MHEPNPLREITLDQLANERQDLLVRNKENLSLYTPEEEIAGLNEIAERLDFPIVIVPIRDKDANLGYMVVPKYPHYKKSRSDRRIRPIFMDAPTEFIDFDDTQAKTSLKKQECWLKLEKLGVPISIVKFCDKLARVTFKEEHGEIYMPQIDMILLEFAMQHSNLPEEDLKVKLKERLKTILKSKETATKTFESIDVRQEIKDIFNETRFNVELYPDTIDILFQLQGEYPEHKDYTVENPGNYRDPVCNVWALTYGEVLFQLEKVLPLLKTGAVSAIFLTKAKKGPFLEQVFAQDVFRAKEMHEAHGGLAFNAIHNLSKPFNPEGMYPIALMDDDPSQVESVNKLSKILGWIIQARRIWSPEHKRGKDPTPRDKNVIEVPRDEDFYIQADMKKIQQRLFAEGIINHLINRFTYWIKRETVYRSDPKYPYVQEFLRVYYNKLFLQAAVYIANAEDISDVQSVYNALIVRFEAAIIDMVEEQIAIREARKAEMSSRPGWKETPEDRRADIQKMMPR